MTQIKRLADGHHALWDTYVQSHPLGTFFHLSSWKTLYETYFNLETYYVYTYQDGVVTGVLPLARVKSKLFSDALISTPFCVYGGALTYDQADTRLLIDEAKRIAHQLGVDYLELRQSFDDILEGHDQSLYVTFKKQLYPNLDDNLKAIPRKQRAVVRKAIKKDLSYQIDTNVDNFYRLYSQSLRNLGTPVLAKSYYQALLETWGDKVDILTVTQHGEPIASTLSFYYQNQVMPYYGGGALRAKQLGANDFMYWSLMAHALSKGCQVFDFGRSKRESGSYRFKTHWGFEASPLHYRYLPIKEQEKPNISPTNHKYQWIIQTWKHLPLSVANTIGPWVARKIG